MSIQEFLANKDNEDNLKYVPRSYRMDGKTMRETQFLEGLANRYHIESSTNCMKPCWNNLESPVVSQAESDCMTHCTAKALETLTLF